MIESVLTNQTTDFKYQSKATVVIGSDKLKKNTTVLQVKKLREMTQNRAAHIALKLRLK